MEWLRKFLKGNNSLFGSPILNICNFFFLHLFSFVYLFYETFAQCFDPIYFLFHSSSKFYVLIPTLPILCPLETSKQKPSI